MLNENINYSDEIDKILSAVDAIQCYACSGSGYYDNDGSPKCSACYGNGKSEAGYEDRIAQINRYLYMWNEVEADVIDDYAQDDDEMYYRKMAKLNKELRAKLQEVHQKLDSLGLSRKHVGYTK